MGSAKADNRPASLLAWLNWQSTGFVNRGLRVRLPPLASFKENYNVPQTRAQFRELVFKRDRYTCRVCGKVWAKGDADPELKRINAHHITDRHDIPNGGYVVENGITVCEVLCHYRCEQYHESNGKNSYPGLSPEDLYGKIGSSLEAAWGASERLVK